MSDNKSDDQDPERKALWAALEEDPEGYESNRNFGLYCARRRTLSPFSEPHLLKALSLDPPPEDIGELLVSLGETYVGCEKWDMALSVFKTINGIAPNKPDILRNIGNLHYAMGNLEETSETFRNVMDIYEDNATKMALATGVDQRELFGGLIVMTHLGELSQKIDQFLKAHALGYTGDFEPVVFVIEDSLCNPCLLEYWKQYLTLIYLTDENEDEIREQFKERTHLLDITTFPDGRTLPRDIAYPLIQKEWDRQQRPPLLQLTEQHKENGRAWLVQQGMPEDAWFACLHVREAHTYQEDVPWSSNKYRNASIQSYLPAIDAITERGGWVVRVGDKTMTPLKGRKNVIDYALSDEKADWLDIFIMGGAMFFFGVSSGPYNVAICFGVPIVGTNWFPLGPMVYSEQDLFIHKRFINSKTGKALSIAESVAPPLFMSTSPFTIDDNDLEVHENTAEEIENVVVEMMDRLDGRISYSEEDNAQQERYKKMADPYGVEWNCRIGREFLQGHPELLVKE